MADDAPIDPATARARFAAVRAALRRLWARQEKTQPA